MPRNGSGTYNLPAGQPVVTGTTISSSVHNTLASDLGTEITRSLATDGQTPMAANLPMGNNKIVNMAAATLATDAVRYDQVSSIASTITASFAAANGASLSGFQQAGAGAIVSTVQDKNRQIVNAKDFGALPGNTNAQNKTALQLAITALNASAGGVIVVDYDICYGVKTRTPSTWPDFTGTTKPILIQDSSRGFTQDPSVYPTSYDGAQYRVWANTPQTTTPGQHDGNGMFMRGSWNPYFFTSNDANLAAVGNPARTTYDNYRNGFTVGVNGSAAWSFMNGSLAGAGYTTEELSNLQIGAKFSITGDTLGDYVAIIVERKTGSMAYGLGTNAPQARHHFGPVTGSPANYDMMIQSAGVNSQLVLRNSSGSGQDIILRNNAGTFGVNCPSVGDAIQVNYSNRRVWIPGSLQLRLKAQNYSASITIDPALGNIVVIEPTNTSAFTINSPSAPVDPGVILVITISNTFGLALGVATWNSNFKLAGAWVQPAAGFSRTITFFCDGTYWHEMCRNAADKPI